MVNSKWAMEDENETLYRNFVLALFGGDHGSGGGVSGRRGPRYGQRSAHQIWTAGGIA